MNYEEFYLKAQVCEKGIKDKLTNMQKSFKSVTRYSEKGDLKNLLKELTQMQALIGEHENFVNELKELAGNFDAKEYMESGEFAQQMLEYCKEKDVDVKGESPSYDMFPYKVRIDSENQDLYVNRKKVQCVRPLSFVSDIKQNLDKLMKASFNESSFLNELSAAYDRAVAVKSKTLNNIRDDYDLLLKDLYEYLAPMQRYRRDYDQQNYAFDLARLYSTQDLRTKDGRKFEFGSTKNPNKIIRILDPYGNEQLLGTIRFFFAS